MPSSVRKKVSAKAAPLLAAPKPTGEGGPLFNWLQTRSAGLLLHPTCLPGDQGCGVFDRHAVRFLDFLQAAGMKYWQVCPLGPTGYGDSPYQCFSAFAGNPYLVDLAALVPFGLLKAADLAPLAALSADRSDTVRFIKSNRACSRLLTRSSSNSAPRCPTATLLASAGNTRIGSTPMPFSAP